MPASPDANGEAARAGFEIGDASLQRSARRVGGTRVVVALVHAGARLHVGRRRVDRRHDRAGRRIGLLAGVDRARRESRVASLAAGLEVGSFTAGFSAER